jgi:hypothetical protein
MQSPFHISYSSGALFLSLQAKKKNKEKKELQGHFTSN